MVVGAIVTPISIFSCQGFKEHSLSYRYSITLVYLTVLIAVLLSRILGPFPTRPSLVLAHHFKWDYRIRSNLFLSLATPESNMQARYNTSTRLTHSDIQ